MKTYHYVALLVVVALIGAGYVMTVWMNATLPKERVVETASNEVNAAVEDTASTEGGTPQRQEGVAQVETGEAAPVSEVDEGAGVETGETASDNSASPKADTTEGTAATSAPPVSANAGGRLVVETQQLEPGKMSESFVQITMRAADQAIDLSGWSLSDNSDAASRTGNVYYFNDGQVLQSGQTLTLNSACGRDTSDTLYWCLAHPLAVLSAEQNGLFFRNAQGELAFSCTPKDQQGDALEYACR